MNIELFGASFDPPHNGHKEVVQGVLGLGIFDEVKLVPAKQHPFSKQLSPDEYRLAMLKLFLEDFKGQPVQIDTFELNKDGVSYSYQTLMHFAQTYPEDTFAWLIGSDNLPSFKKWYEWQALLDRFPVYVYPRPGHPMSPLLLGMIPLPEVEGVAISSTEVRNRVKAGQEIYGLVGQSVAAYINEHNLYR